MNWDAVIQVIEEEFGHDWLHDDRTEINHPVKIAWQAAVQANVNPPNGKIDISENEMLSWLMFFALELNFVRNLQNFRDVITQKKLCNPIKFASLAYEMSIACIWGSNINQKIEFVKAQIKLSSDDEAKKTPDLKIISRGDEFYIECRAKELYSIKERRDNSELSRLVIQGIHALVQETAFKGNFELTILIPGELDESTVPIILSDCKSAFQSNFVGRKIGKRIGIVLERKHFAPLTTPDKTSLFQPYVLGSKPMAGAEISESVLGTISKDSHGNIQIIEPFRVRLFEFTSHKISSVWNSLNEKLQRKQIPKDAVGMIYLNIDTSNLDHNTAELNMDVIAESIDMKFQAFKKGRRNTRVAGVAITTEYRNVPVVKENNKIEIERLRLQRLIWNPVSRVPEGITIPGNPANDPMR